MGETEDGIRSQRDPHYQDSSSQNRVICHFSEVKNNYDILWESQEYGL